MNELGNISISSEVVASIAETIISEIEGVYSLAGSNSKNVIVNFFQNVSSSGSKGIEVVDGITDMTGLKVQEVNVFIQKVVKVEEESKEVVEAVPVIED